MRSIPLWGTILVLWLLGGIWLYNNSACCLGVSNPLSILDGSTKVASTASNMMFAASGFAPIIPSEVKSELGNLSKYLAENPDRKLNLAGLYSANENNTSSFENLGLARAAALKDSLVAMGIDDFRIGISGGLQDESSLVTDAEKNIYGGINYEFGKMFISRSIEFNDGQNFEVSLEENLRFANSDFNILGDLSANLQAAFQKMADYLKSNPGRSIDIKGFYMDAENNTSLLQDLGLGRANSIKSLLLSMGVSAKQITTSSEMFPDLARDGTNIIGGATYSFFDTPADDDKLAEVEARLRKAPVVLYFQPNANRIALNAEQRAFMADLIYYLDNKEGGQAISVGHTDNVGGLASNIELSKARALFVRNYLSSQGGISSNKIITKGEGPNSPVAGNNSSEGRAKNRRVEISIK